MTYRVSDIVGNLLLCSTDVGIVDDCVMLTSDILILVVVLLYNVENIFAVSGRISV
jgi:hypothetical protein